MLCPYGPEIDTQRGQDTHTHLSLALIFCQIIHTVLQYAFAQSHLPCIIFIGFITFFYINYFFYVMTDQSSAIFV